MASSVLHTKRAGGAGRGSVLPTLAVLVAVAGCAVNAAEPRQTAPAPESRAVVAGPLPGGPLPRAADELAAGLSEIEAGNPDAAYGHLTAVLEQCGASALGQRALLALAAAELDPTNPDPRRNLAAEAAAQVAARQDADTWPGQLARTLYGVALRVGARPVESVLPATIELYEGSVAFAAYPTRPAADCARAEPWPGPILSETRPLPAVPGASYPARLGALQRRIVALEEELERLRRLTKP